MSDFTPDEIRVLKALASGLLKASAPAGASSPSAAALPDSQLNQEWADKLVTRDPKRWQGESMVQRRYSDCPAEWHDENASFYEWKAERGREEQPVRLNNKGKPWHEADTFEAKLSRAWAKRIRARKPAPASTETPPMFTDEKIPF